MNSLQLLLDVDAMTTVEIELDIDMVESLVTKSLLHATGGY